jgi:hypothetical protein
MEFIRPGDCITPHDLEYVPEEWKAPLIDVLDTAGCVYTYIKTSVDMPLSPELVLGLTRLVLERHDKESAANHNEPPELLTTDQEEKLRKDLTEIFEAIEQRCRAASQKGAFQ